MRTKKQMQRECPSADPNRLLEWEAHIRLDISHTAIGQDAAISPPTSPFMQKASGNTRDEHEPISSHTTCSFDSERRRWKHGRWNATCNFLDENARITMNLGHARPTSAPARMGTQALEYAQLQDGTQQFEEQKPGRF